MDESDCEWSALDVRTRALIRAILYPVMFSSDPGEDDLARIFEMVVDCRALGASPDEYQAAIQKVLADQIPLQGHSLTAVARPDAVTLKFLQMVLRRLEHEADSPGC